MFDTNLENKSFSEPRQVILFRLAEELYAVDVKHVQSIERIGSITRIPDAPPYLKGVINLRGVVTPVVDLRLKLGLTAEALHDGSRLIIVHVPPYDVALIVDSADEVLEIDADRLQPAPDIGANAVPYIEGVVDIDGRLIVLLDLTKVLKESETALLEGAVEETHPVKEGPSI